MEIPRVEPCRLPGASGLHKCAGTQPLHQDLSLSGEGAGSALAPRGRCSPLLVWIAWLSKGFVDLDLSYHRTCFPLALHTCAITNGSHLVILKPAELHPRPAFSFTGAKL